MHLLFNDQAEYYVVCDECYYEFRRMQWAGSTRNPNWRTDSESLLRSHERDGKPCEFCGPGGNGGWMVDGKFPAAERADARKKQNSSEGD